MGVKVLEKNHLVLPRHLLKEDHRLRVVLVAVARRTIPVHKIEIYMVRRQKEDRNRRLKKEQQQIITILATTTTATTATATATTATW